MFPEVENRVSPSSKAIPETSLELYFLLFSEKAVLRTIQRFAIESVQYALVSCISASEGAALSVAALFASTPALAERIVALPVDVVGHVPPFLPAKSVEVLLRF